MLTAMRARGAAALLVLAAASIWPVAVAAPEFPALAGRVVDTAGMLSPATEDALAATLQAHEQSTGNQVVAVTVNTLDGYAIEEYGVALGRDWGIGEGERNNGVLLIVARAEREIRIEVGYGLEGALPDALAGQIIRHEITPPFRRGDFDAGITAGVDAILAAIQGEYTARPAPDQRALRAFLPFFLLLGLFVLIVFLSTRYGGRGLGAAGAPAGGWGTGVSTGGFGGGGGFSGGGGFGGGGGSFGGGGASGGW